MPVQRMVILVKGIVQGVGFRPFVFRFAKEYGLKGLVTNNPEGVIIDLEGERRLLDKFVNCLQEEAPPLSKIENIHIEFKDVIGHKDFLVGITGITGSMEALVATDTCICEDCLAEMLDKDNRRYLYPFINCTNCGPRFTIIKDIPYDRKNTTMSVFPMCPECLSEYTDPGNRRFHAQPNACAGCGPRVELRDSSAGIIDKTNPIETTAEFLRKGAIIGIKGLGGYHLACNALDDEAVGMLRERKIREDKPFAVMVSDLMQASLYCNLNDKEKKILSDHARPIVLLKKCNELLAEKVAPGNAYLGIMLPYTPLHYLLFKYIDFPLVMTSGNLSDEPIAYDDSDAYLRLGHIVDYFLTHNRKIHHRCDDSVTRVFKGEDYILRRSRGYTPAPIKLNRELGQVLAVGGEQKNTFCLTKGNYAFVSHHIGDLENLETLQAFEYEIEMYKKLFHIEPDLVAYDYHPEYLSNKYALDLPEIKKTGIQHHHAHIASCMAEHGLDGHVLGVAFDGTGFGPDGSIWGGEFLYTSLTDYKRWCHLKYVPMPGGARAVKEPWRMAVGYLYWFSAKTWRSHQGVKFLKEKNGMLLDSMGEILEQLINCPPTSSMGRLFDAVAALIGVRDMVNYEGQAAVEMEQMAVNVALKTESNYNYDIVENDGRWEINTDPLIGEILKDISANEDRGIMAVKFHHAVKKMVTDTCLMGREIYGENRVCLSGGVFQNMLLLDLVHRDLEKNGFQVFIHRIVPANDGGISLGQAVIAAERRNRGCV
jgi:hydrogenase maturation protein HypF